MRRVFRWVFRAAVAVVLLLIMTVYVPPLFGLLVYEVGSGSMEPELKTGALVFVRQGQFVQEGDIIAFQLKGQACCVHRCIAVGEDGTYVTREITMMSRMYVCQPRGDHRKGGMVCAVYGICDGFFSYRAGNRTYAGIFMGAMILELILKDIFGPGALRFIIEKLMKNRR